MPQDMVFGIMLIQCDYQVGDFLLQKGNIYYKGNIISPANITPVLACGTDELFLVQGKFPLKYPWIVILQSRYPVFYECKGVEFKDEKVILTLANDKRLAVKQLKNGVCDRLYTEP